MRVRYWLLGGCLAALLALAACTAPPVTPTPAGSGLLENPAPGIQANTATPAAVDSTATATATVTVTAAATVTSTAAGQTAAPDPTQTATMATPLTPTLAVLSPTAMASAPVPTTPVATVPAAPPTATASPQALGGWLAYVDGAQIVARLPSTGRTTTLIADPTGNGSGVAPGDLHWSPSGRRLLYSLEPTLAMTQPVVMAFDLDQAKLWNLGIGYNPAWSADSAHIALERSAQGATQVVVVTLPGGTEEALGAGESPAWLPDGQHVAVFRDGNIWLLPYPPGGAATQVTHLATDPDSIFFGEGLRYHYSGHILFYGGHTTSASGNGLSLYAADLQTGAVKAWSQPGGNRLVALEVSPDGRYVALADQAHSSACASYGSVAIVDTTTGGQTMLALPATDERHARVMGLSWSPEATGQLAVSYDEYSCANTPGVLTPARIFLVSMGAPTTLHLETPGAWPAWNRGNTALGQAPDIWAAENGAAR